MRAPWIALVAVVTLASSAAATPRDFTSETRTLFAVAACGEPAPTTHDATVIAAHCKAVAKTTAAWKANWRDKAAPFFAEQLGSTVPTRVVYPFGGGDLSTALAVYPNATDYTTLSLEGMGDPRPLAALGGKSGAARLTAELAKLRTVLAANLGWAWNTTIQLSIDSSGSGAGLPGILTLTLVALDASGYEPLEVRYFRIADDGAIAYVTAEELAAWDTRPRATRRKPTNAVQEGLFNNVEIVFRAKGAASAPKKTFRHVTADLSDGGLAKGGTRKFLEREQGFAAITKAASYLLWKPAGFTTIRDLLLARMTVMVSDDTGIPPRYAGPAGFTQDVWGTYLGAFFTFANREIDKELVAFWKSASKGPLPFRFGYYDHKRNPHLMITRKK